jgi:hypothetical protein
MALLGVGWLTLPLVQMVLAIPILVSCTETLAPGDVVRDRDSAIRVGQVKCRIGPKNMSLPLNNWHARLDGDYWKVWQGTRQNGHAFLEVSVAKQDGTATECLMTVE